MQQIVVVPLDGSPLAEHALPYATSLARRLEARVILMHARSLPRRPDPCAPDLDAITARLAASGIDVGMHLAHLPTSEDTGRVLVSAMSELGGTMMVLATHGRGGLTRLVYGSVADQVLRQAETPVLLVSLTCDRPLPAEGPLRILVPLDGSDFAEAILPPLIQLAGAAEIELLLLRVAETIEPRVHGDECVRCRLMRERNEEPDLEYVRANRYITEVAGRLRDTGLIVASRMVVGHAPTEIGRIARERQVDLIAMATHGRSGLARLVMGSVATATLQQSGVPVLMIRPQTLRHEDERPSPAPHGATTATVAAGALALKVRDIMSAPVVTVTTDTTLHDVARQMLEHGIGSVPVVDAQGRVQGIISETDFTGKECYIPFSTFRQPRVFGAWMPHEGVEAIYRAARTMTARDIMSAPVFSAVEDEPVSALARRMVEHNIKRLPVVRGALPVGMVTRHDLLRLMIDPDSAPPVAASKMGTSAAGSEVTTVQGV